MKKLPLGVGFSQAPSAFPVQAREKILLGKIATKSSNIRDIIWLNKIIREALKQGRARIKKSYPVAHFPDGGVTIMRVLEQSAFVLETWLDCEPGIHVVGVTIITCGQEANPEIAFDYLSRQLNAMKQEHQVFSQDLGQWIADI